MKAFGEQHGVEVQVTPYSNYDEMLSKIRAPGESFDLVFPGPSVLSKMVYTELIQPLNHSYVPNLENVWPEYQDPWYDRGARYTVPYTIYGTGVLYRADRVSSVPENGYDLMWDEQYSGKVYLLDDMQEAIGMSLLRNEITTDINTSDPDARPRGHRLAHRADRPGEGQGERQRLLRGPRGHRHDPPGLVGRPDRRSVLPAQGRDHRRAGLLASRGPLGTRHRQRQHRDPQERDQARARTPDDQRPPRQPRSPCATSAGTATSRR